MIRYSLHDLSLAQTILNLPASEHILEDLLDALEALVNVPGVEICLPEDFYSIIVDDQAIGVHLYERIYLEHRDMVVRLQRLLADTANGIYSESSYVEFFNNDRQGALILSAKDARKIDFIDVECVVSNLRHVSIAARFLFVKGNKKESDLKTFLSIMFPNLFFAAQPSFGKMKISYAEHRETVLDHLSWLNDYGQSQFEGHKNPDQLVAHAASLGIDISPESPGTRSKQKSMNERNININGALICCEWHTKITPTKGRIHFYPWLSARPLAVKNTTNDKLIIGIFSDHLST